MGAEAAEKKKRSFLMTFIWFGLGGALLVVAVVVVGLLMPERYEGRSQVVYD